jgi:hypothetical protein
VIAHQTPATEVAELTLIELAAVHLVKEHWVERLVGLREDL